MRHARYEGVRRRFALLAGGGAVIGTVAKNTSLPVPRVSPAAARIVPFAVFIGFIMIQSVAAELLTARGIDERWLYAARVIVVGGLLAWFWRTYTELHTFAGITAGNLLLAIASGVAVFLVWINLDFEWARFGTPGAFDPSLPDGSGLAWQFVIFRLLGLAIIVPVMEELFWRSFVLRWLEKSDFLSVDPARVGFRAMLICATLFALEHTLWLAGLIAGFVYVLVYVYGRNLWLAVISHAITNAILGWWILTTRQWQFW